MGSDGCRTTTGGDCRRSGRDSPGVSRIAEPAGGSQFAARRDDTALNSDAATQEAVRRRTGTPAGEPEETVGGCEEGGQDETQLGHTRAPSTILPTCSVAST